MTATTFTFGATHDSDERPVQERDSWVNLRKGGLSHDRNRGGDLAQGFAGVHCSGRRRRFDSVIPTRTSSSQPTV